MSSTIAKAKFADRAWHRGSHDLLALQEAMGHASPVTTRGYVLVELDDLRDLIKAAS